MRIHTTLLGLLLLAGPPSAAQGDAPSPEKVAAFKQELEAALEPGADARSRREQILKAHGFPDASIVAVLQTKGLRHEDRAVREDAVGTLGRMQHPEALKALEEMYVRDEKQLESDPPLHAHLIRSIARHGSPGSVKLLAKDLFQAPDQGVIRARILGLGNIRAKDAVDELIQMMRSVARPRVADFMLEMRTALYMLTGVDKGTDQNLWINWYGDAKSSLEIALEPPVERPAEIRRCWMLFWGPEIAKPKFGPREPRGKGKGKEKRDKKEAGEE